jgi:hypothetical protein
MDNYDIIIIGGGVTGLNILYNLYKDKSNKKILLIEKNNYLGGRIKTYRKKINNIDYQWEEGAARFNNKHKLLLKLIKELDLENYIVDAPSKITFVPSNNVIKEKYINKNPFEYVNKIAKKIEKDNITETKKYTFKDYAIKKKIITKEDFDFVTDSFGYYSELIEMNAYDAMHLFKEGITNKLKFHGLSCGLDKIIERIYEKIKNKLNLKIVLNSTVKNIKYNKNFIIKTEKEIFNCETCILAIPKPNLLKLKILEPINNLLETIVCKPLCRIYAIYKDIWFQNIKKTTTNNHLRYIIPIDKKTGLIMISYTDNIFAEYWENKNKILPIIKKSIKLTFNRDVDDPIFIKKSYWKCGVGYWKKNIDSNFISTKIEKPFNIPLYICGENYSLTQGWIEGALISSNKIFDLIKF